MKCNYSGTIPGPHSALGGPQNKLLGSTRKRIPRLYLQLHKKSLRCPPYYIHVQREALSQLSNVENDGGEQLTTFISLKKEVQNNQSEKEDRLKRAGKITKKKIMQQHNTAVK